ncbi:hypothetical protein [Glycomyces buryatensis]|uniref:Uncharacterized protein n=1 Tax=Glycomyces buryatensis TaxID=2570927 RepID=A0A4S8QQA7_9ACTN|nr:hypothetical protein [Glycomyces buryatensis]THV43609.1 hypothetical protein FAB82_00705 [Glycomyces buryatensis]
MSYPPYPPATGQPQLAGPGGAYGPIESNPGQIVPGQLPPPSMTMTKPGTVLGIQVILWIFAAIAAIGDVYQAIQMVEYENPLLLIGLAYSIYSTIQGLLSPVQIERGKRGWWLWNVINSGLGAVIALVVIIYALGVVEYTAMPLLMGLGLGGLQGTMFVLLVTKSARSWILMHHIQRGKLRSLGTPAPGAVGVLVKISPQRPESKPGMVTALQLMLWFVALSPVMFTILTIVWAQDALEREIRIGWETPGTSPSEYLLESDFILGIIFSLVAVVALSILAIISAIGLQRGRFWARVYTPIWLGIVTLLLALTTIACWVNFSPGEFDDVSDATATLGVIVSLVFTGAFITAIVAFIMVFLPGTRSWAPGEETVISYLPGAQGQPLPGQPAMATPAGYGPPSQAPGYGPSPQGSGYPPQQQQHPGYGAPQAQQPSPYPPPPDRAQAPQGYPQQGPPPGGGGYPPQSPPPGGGGYGPRY